MTPLSVSARMLTCAFMLVLSLNGCASLPRPDEIVAPMPMSGNSGKYMCPYTRYGQTAPWVKKLGGVEFGAKVGKSIGRYAGKQALQQVPYIGGFLGETVGKEVGRVIAIEAAGGMDYIKATSDQCFNSVDDLAVYIYAKHSDHYEYDKVLKMTRNVYPAIRFRYHHAIRKAARKAIKKAEPERRSSEVATRDSRVSHATTAPVPGAAPAATPAPGAAWKRLRPGMGEEQVRQTLGEPGETSRGAESLIWYYPDWRGGHVAFVHGRVHSWREPSGTLPSPAVSRQPSAVSLASKQSENLGLCAMRADGTDQKRLNRKALNTGGRRDAADGKKIILTSLKDRTLDPYAMALDRDKERRITDGRRVRPAGLPEHEILFRTDDPLGRRVYGEVLVRSLSRHTPSRERRTIARAIADFEGLDDLTLYCTLAAREAHYSMDYADQYPCALAEGLLGTLERGRFKAYSSDQ